MSEPPFLLHSGARSIPDAGERPTGRKRPKTPRIRRASTRRRGHAPGMGRFGIDVRRHRVRLDSIAVDAGAGGGVVDGIEDGEELARAVTVPERGPGHDGPDRGMRVLASVLAHAGRIALDVSGIAGGPGKARRE